MKGLVLDHWNSSCWLKSSHFEKATVISRKVGVSSELYGVNFVFWYALSPTVNVIFCHLLFDGRMQINNTGYIETTRVKWMAQFH